MLATTINRWIGDIALSIQAKNGNTSKMVTWTAVIVIALVAPLAGNAL
jgi:hypothetical protein